MPHLHLHAYHDTDPEDVCTKCEGTGLLRWFDADTGWTFDECPRCEGVAVAGYFAVQFVVGRRRDERNGRLGSFEFAKSRAHRWASLFRLFCQDPPAEVADAEVHVVYVPHGTRCEEVVHVERVWERRPLRAA